MRGMEENGKQPDSWWIKKEDDGGAQQVVPTQT